MSGDRTGGDRATCDLPAGWRRRSVEVDELGALEVLTARHPAPPLQLRAPRAGTWQLSLGLYREAGTFCEVEIQLADGLWQTVRPVYFIDDREGGVQEVRLDACAFRDGDSIRIRPVQRHASQCGLAWLRFEVPGPADVRHRGRVGAVCDPHGMFARGSFEGVDDIHGLLQPFVDSDFDRICFGMGAGSFRMLYFSSVLPWFGKDCDRLHNEANARVAQTLGVFRKQQLDPVRVAIEFCHNNGLQFWASDRICHCFAPGAYGDDFAAPFYLDNPQLRTVHEDGSRGNTVSPAHRDYQDLKLALYREWLEMGADGIYIDLQRKPGIVGIDAPAVEAFRREVGRTPAAADFRTLRWLQIRARVITDFIRRVRGLLDDFDSSRRIPLAIQGFMGGRFLADGQIDENLIQGYAINEWAAEGLIDVFAPSTSRHYAPQILGPYRRWTDDTACELWGCLGQFHNCLFPADYRHEVYFGNDPEKFITPIADLDVRRVMQTAADCYAQGADGVFLWEAGETPQCPERWQSLRCLGDRERLQQDFSAAIGPLDGRHRRPRGEPVDGWL